MNKIFQLRFCSKRSSRPAGAGRVPWPAGALSCLRGGVSVPLRVCIPFLSNLGERQEAKAPEKTGNILWIRRASQILFSSVSHHQNSLVVPSAPYLKHKDAVAVPAEAAGVVLWLPTTQGYFTCFDWLNCLVFWSQMWYLRKIFDDPIVIFYLDT